MSLITCPCLNIHIHTAEAITKPIAKDVFEVEINNIASIKKVFESLVLSHESSTSSSLSIVQTNEENEGDGNKGWTSYECLHCGSGPVYSTKSQHSKHIVVYENAMVYSSIQEAIEQAHNYSSTLNVILSEDEMKNEDNIITVSQIPSSSKDVPERLKPFYKEIKQKLDQTIKRLHLGSKVRPDMLKDEKIRKGEARVAQETVEKSVQQAIADSNRIWARVVAKLKDLPHDRQQMCDNDKEDNKNSDEEDETIFFLDEEIISDDDDNNMDREKLLQSLSEMDRKFTRWIKKRSSFDQKKCTECDDDEDNSKDKIKDSDGDKGPAIYLEDFVEKKRAENHIDELAISKFATSVPITIKYFNPMESNQDPGDKIEEEETEIDGILYTKSNKRYSMTSQLFTNTYVDNEANDKWLKKNGISKADLQEYNHQQKMFLSKSMFVKPQLDSLIGQVESLDTRGRLPTTNSDRMHSHPEKTKRNSLAKVEEVTIEDEK